MSWDRIWFAQNEEGQVLTAGGLLSEEFEEAFTSDSAQPVRELAQKSGAPRLTLIGMRDGGSFETELVWIPAAKETQ